MLKQRFFTILVLVPVLLGIIYFIPSLIFKQIILVFALIAGYEWTNLIPIYRLTSKIWFLFGLFFLILLANIYFEPLLLISLVFLAAVVFIVLYYPNSLKFFGNPTMVGLAAMILLPVFYASVVFIYEGVNGKGYLLYILLLIWATDTGAYVFGKLFGKHKLIVAVSPGKTIEGSIGGFLSAMLVAFLAYVFFKPMNILVWIVAAALISIISVFGDLFISVLKRRVKIKDTGNIFPGHGGMLDRIDSLLTALPVFYSLLLFTTLGI